MWVCPPDTTPMIIDHYNNIYDLPEVSLGARASVVGKIRQDGMYVVRNGKEKIINAPASEVTKGFLYDRPFSRPQVNHYEPEIENPVHSHHSGLPWPMKHPVQGHRPHWNR